MSASGQERTAGACAAALERLDEPVVVEVVKEHHIAQARQTAKVLAEALGLRKIATCYAATSVSELAGNLFFHARGDRTITLVGVRRNGSVGIEITAQDQGPGIEDVAAAMRDGFTTNGGLGGGLPGVERLMDEFEIESAPATGTRVVARKWSPCE